MFNTERTPDLNVSPLYPLFYVKGHGSHWRAIIEEGKTFILDANGRIIIDQSIGCIIIRTSEREFVYKSYAEDYIETISNLWNKSGSEKNKWVCEDIRAVFTTETEFFDLKL